MNREFLYALHKDINCVHADKKCIVENASAGKNFAK